MKFFDYELTLEIENIDFLSNNSGHPVVVSCLNPHSFVKAENDSVFKEALRHSDYLIPDGVGICMEVHRWAGKQIKKIAGDDFHLHVLDQFIVASGDFFSSYGGGQVYVKNLVDEMIRQQIEADITLSIISFASTFPINVQQKEYKGVPLYEMHPDGNILQLLKTISPDIVHAHGEKAKVAQACHELGIKCVITAHHGGILCPAGTLLNYKDEICHTAASFEKCLPCYLRTIRSGRYWYPLVKHIPYQRYLKIGDRLKRLPFIPFITPIGQAARSIQGKLDAWNTIKENADLIVAPSNAIANRMTLNGLSEDKVQVVPHGIPIPQGEYSFPSTEGPISFYYVGRINYVKGIHILLKAFSSIHDPNIELHLIGGAENKAEHRYMSKLQKKYQKDARIQWHGKVPYEQLPSLIKEYHCLIHPAIYLEVFGLNISEALAQGKYVIATRCGGAEMQIHNRIGGMMIRPNNYKELAKAIFDYTSTPIASKSYVNKIDRHVYDLTKLYKS